MPIFDQGYQHWNGELSSHAWRWLTVARQGVRAQMKNRLTRVVLIFALMPALGLALALVFWGLLEQRSELVEPIFAILRLPPGLTANPEAFRRPVWNIAFHFFFTVELFFSMILVVLVGPGLISQDLRFNAVPLYFSRPLRRFDYFLGKLGVIGFFLAVITVAPVLLAYVFGILFSLDLGVVKDTWQCLLAGIVYGLVVVFSAGTLMLALSSLSRNSRYVGLFWVGVWLISNTVGMILNGLHEESIYREARNAEFEQSRRDGQIVYDPNQWRRIQEKAVEARAEAARKNWRPLFSYTANLDRIRAELFGTHASFLEFGKLVGDNGEVADQMVPNFPWFWSAGVLAGLFGISVWILTTRVKSLDRLK